MLTTDLEALPYEAQFSFSVNMVDPVPILKGPSKVGTDDDLYLDGTDSYDPNNDPGGIRYTWTCFNVSVIPEAINIKPCLKLSYVRQAILLHCVVQLSQYLLHSDLCVDL